MSAKTLLVPCSWIILLWIPTVVLGQDFHPSRPDPTCVCDPLCEPMPGLRLLSNCTRVTRTDCPCCQVCASLEGEKCDDVTHPCDVSRKLVCDPGEKVCKGKITIFKSDAFRTRERVWLYCDLHYSLLDIIPDSKAPTMSHL